MTHTTDPATRTSTTATVADYHQPPAGIGTIQLFRPQGIFVQYVDAKLAAIRPKMVALADAIDSGDLVAAQRTWLSAHVAWQEIGEDDLQYGAFGDLGGAIDGLASGLAGGTRSQQFTGFHKVELDLFRRHDLRAANVDDARLTRDVDSITPNVVAADFPLNAAGLNSWVLRTHEILEDALRDSLSQDDDYGSNSDLASVRADVVATREMLKALAGLIDPRQPGLVTAAERQLDQVDAALDAAPESGSALSRLPLRVRQRIDGTVNNALETLAPVSELMTITNSNS